MAIKPVSGEVKSQDINDNLSYLDSKLDQVNGGPLGSLGSVAELNQKYPNGANGFFIIDGHMYFWENSKWVDKGVYQARDIADNSVRNTHLASKAVNSRVIQDDAVSTEALKNKSVTSEKLGDYSVKSGNISDGAVHQDKIRDGSVFNRHLNDNSINERVIYPKALSNNVLADETIISRSIAEDNVNFTHQNFIKLSTKAQEVKKGNFWISMKTNLIYAEKNLRSASVTISNSKHYKLIVKGDINRLTIFSSNSLSIGSKAELFYSYSGDYAKLKKEYTFYFDNNDNHSYLTVGYQNNLTSNLDDNVTISVEELDNNLVNQVAVKDSYQKLDTIWYNHETDTISNVNTERALLVPINKKSNIIIETFGLHDRFIVATTDKSSVEDMGSFDLKIVSDSVDGNINYEFYNKNDTFLYLGLSASVNELQKVSVIQSIEYTDSANQQSSTESYNTIMNTSEISPVLWAVKTTNSRNDEVPRPIGWLYYLPVYPFPIYYASGEPSRMEYLCNWNSSATWNNVSTPEQYHAHVTKSGDIICVWRGDLVGTGQDLDNVRQNPIIYKSNDWKNPKEIILGDLKPTAWLQSCGVDYIDNSDTFIFAEYTRPSHETANIWTVTKPFDNPENWKVTQSYILSGDNNHGMKHFHTINYDPFSGFTYSSTGDDDSASKILESRDNGKTWQVVFEGNRRYARVLNFIFLENDIYWANDDSNHGFFRAKRKADKSVDFSNIETLHDLANYPPTYANIYFEEPHGILILNRYDGATTKPLDVLFYSIEDEKIHTVASLEPTSNSNYGFRLEAAELYPRRVSEGTVVGFANPMNQIKVLGNRGSNNLENVNNLQLKLLNKDDVFELKIETIFN